MVDEKAGVGNGLLAARAGTGGEKGRPGKGKVPDDLLRCAIPSVVMSTPTAETVSFAGEPQTSGTLLVEGGGVDIEFNELELPPNKSAIGVPLITPSPGTV